MAQTPLRILSLLRLPISPQQHVVVLYHIPAALVKRRKKKGVSYADISRLMHGIDLGGWLSQCRHTEAHYDSFITEADIARIASWGLDHVRLPFDYDLIETADGTRIDAGYVRLNRVADWCAKHGLNIILDLHKTAGFSFDAGEAESGFFDSPAYQERFYALWETLAREFGAEHDHIAFELLNEVTDRSFCERWNAIAETCIRRIRAVAPEVYILIGGYWNNSIRALPDLLPPTDDRIVYNFHCYEPLIFTHQGAGWVPGMPADLRLSYPAAAMDYRAAMTASMDPAVLLTGMQNGADADAEMFLEMFRQAAEIAEERDVPLYCGEYGVIMYADDESTLNWYRAIHAAFERFGIGRAAWTYRSMHYGITDGCRAAIADKLITLL